MPQMRNTITGRINWMPDSYIGQFPFEVVEEAPVAEPVVEAKPARPRKKKAEYVPDATDGDGDGLVQDGTIFERPVGTELSPEEVTEILASTEE
jgi:hypothetical protein